MIKVRTERWRRRLARDEGGVAAVEFAILLPLMLLVFFGGITMVNVINVSRKITITTRALADLTSQYTSVTSSNMSTIMNASSQILAPYSTTPLGIRVSEFSVTVTNTGLLAVTTCKVMWSTAQGPGMTAYASGTGSTCTVPAGLIPTPSGISVGVGVGVGGVGGVGAGVSVGVGTVTNYLIYAETSYAYTTPFNSVGALNLYGVQWIPNGFGTFNLGDRIFMLPRLSTSITYSGS